MKAHIMYVTLLLASLQSFCQFDPNNLGYHFGIIRVPLSSEGFENFHISDWQDFGLGSVEGRVEVPLAEENPSFTTGLLGGLIYRFNDKWNGIMELGIGFTDFATFGLILGAEYTIVDAGFIEVRSILKFGSTTGYGGSTTAQLLPDKTPPVILEEGTFNVGDPIEVNFTNLPLQIGFKPVFDISQKLALYGNFYYSTSFSNEATIEAGEIEIPFESPAIVKDNGSSTQAGITPELKVSGLGFDFGVIIQK